MASLPDFAKLLPNPIIFLSISVHYSLYIIYHHMKRLSNYLFFLLAFLSACNGGNDFSTTLPAQNNANPHVEKKDTTERTIVKNITTARAPIINIEDTTISPFFLVAFKDSAANLNIFKTKLSKIITSKIKSGTDSASFVNLQSPVSVMKSKNAPYFFEAGFASNKKVKKTTSPIFQKTISGGKAVVAHFYGPYDIINIAYTSAEEYLSMRGYTKTGTGLEAYEMQTLDSIGKNLNPYKIRTDIIIFYKENLK